MELTCFDATNCYSGLCSLWMLQCSRGFFWQAFVLVGVFEPFYLVYYCVDFYKLLRNVIDLPQLYPWMLMSDRRAESDVLGLVLQVSLLLSCKICISSVASTSKKFCMYIPPLLSILSTFFWTFLRFLYMVASFAVDRSIGRTLVFLDAMCCFISFCCCVCFRDIIRNFCLEFRSGGWCNLNLSSA